MELPVNTRSTTAKKENSEAKAIKPIVPKQRRNLVAQAIIKEAAYAAPVLDRRIFINTAATINLPDFVKLAAKKLREGTRY